jgi:hypothetical protein
MKNITPTLIEEKETNRPSTSSEAFNHSKDENWSKISKNAFRKRTS